MGFKRIYGSHFYLMYTLLPSSPSIWDALLKAVTVPHQTWITTPLSNLTLSHHRVRVVTISSSRQHRPKLPSCSTKRITIHATWPSSRNCSSMEWWRGRAKTPNFRSRSLKLRAKQKFHKKENLKLNKLMERLLYQRRNASQTNLSFCKPLHQTNLVFWQCGAAAARKTKSLRWT